MDSFIFFSQSELQAFVHKRAGETKLGENVCCISAMEQLPACPAKFVLLGIPEDIGVRANNGIGGADTAWIPALTAFLNIQSNAFLNGNEVCVAGYFDIQTPDDPTIANLRDKVSSIDALVSPVIEKIIRAGKIPVVIGGGHNNAAPILSGMSLGKQQAVHTINIDAHADLRTLNEGRHSGNGFSAALANGHLDTYHIFGLHENYNNAYTLDTIAADKNIRVCFFDFLLQSEKSIAENWKAFVRDIPSPCGLEMDLDSIENVLSSAITPTGFALNDIRKCLLTGGKQLGYLHVCEGAVKRPDGLESALTGKTIAYLISDFIKAQITLK